MNLRDSKKYIKRHILNGVKKHHWELCTGEWGDREKRGCALTMCIPPSVFAKAISTMQKLGAKHDDLMQKSMDGSLAASAKLDQVDDKLALFEDGDWEETQVSKILGWSGQKVSSFIAGFDGPEDPMPTKGAVSHWKLGREIRLWAEDQNLFRDS